MTYEIKPNSLIITTYEGSTCGLNLEDYEDLTLRYNRGCDNVIIEGSKVVRDRFLVPMQKPVTPKPPVTRKQAPLDVVDEDIHDMNTDLFNLLNEITGSNVDLDEEYAKVGAVAPSTSAEPGIIRTQTGTRKGTTRRVYNQSKHKLCNFTPAQLADIYLGYRSGTSLHVMADANDLKEVTLRNWMSHINRLVKNVHKGRCSKKFMDTHLHLKKFGLVDANGTLM